jgi:hypothetical protein
VRWVPTLSARHRRRPSRRQAKMWGYRTEGRLARPWRVPRLLPRGHSIRAVPEGARLRLRRCVGRAEGRAMCHQPPPEVAPTPVGGPRARRVARQPRGRHNQPPTTARERDCGMVRRQWRGLRSRHDGWGDQAVPQALTPVGVLRSPPFGRGARFGLGHPGLSVDPVPDRAPCGSVTWPFGDLNVDGEWLPAPQHLERNGLSRARAGDPLR